MKILIYIPQLIYGGAEKVLVSFANDLASRGHEVEVLELYENEADEKKKAAYKIAVDELEMHKNKYPGLWIMIEEKYNCLTAE